MQKIIFLNRLMKISHWQGGLASFYKKKKNVHKHKKEEEWLRRTYRPKKKPTHDARFSELLGAVLTEIGVDSLDGSMDLDGVFTPAPSGRAVGVAAVCE